MCSGPGVETSLGTYNLDDEYRNEVGLISERTASRTLNSPHSTKAFSFLLLDRPWFFARSDSRDEKTQIIEEKGDRDLTDGPTNVERQCTLMLKDPFAQPPVPDTARTNAKYHNWDVKEYRLAFANGHQDPLGEATTAVESQNLVGTPLQPIEVPDGFRSSDW